MRRFVATAWVVALVLSGCQEDLPKATEITHMRVLGTKLEVIGDETRSTPKPGESVTATFEAVFPSQKHGTEEVQAMLIACTAPERYTGGLPICQEFLDAAAGKVGGDVTKAINVASEVRGTPRDEPEMDVGAAMGRDQKLTCEDLPMPNILVGRLSIQCLRGDPIARFDVDPRFTAERMLFVGVVCEHGTAYLDPNDPLLFGCDDNDGETTRVNGLIPVQYSDADENRNPSIEDDLTLILSTYTAPWLAPEGELPAADNCKDDEQKDQQGPLTLPYADPGRHDIRPRVRRDPAREGRRRAGGPRVHGVYDGRRDGAALHAVRRR